MKNSQNLGREDIGLFLIRLMLATTFLFHGSQKLFGIFDGPGLEGFAGWLESLSIPLPTLNAYIATFVELGGGLALLFGVKLRPMAALLSITMLIAAMTAHTGFNFTKGGMEFPLVLAFVSAGLTLTGGGRLTIMRLFAFSKEPIIAL